MSATRDLSMADINTQLQQAQAFAYSPTAPLPPSGERTTSQYPTERQATVLPSEPPTQIQNPYTLAPYVPGVAPGELAPPPPKSSQKAAQQQRTIAENLRLQRIRIAMQAGQVSRSLDNLFQTQNRNLGSIPTPGGIWIPFWILVGLYLILIPVNGHPRLNWLWLAIIGTASVGVANSMTNGTPVGNVTPTITTTPTLPIITPTPTSIVPLTSQGLTPFLSTDYLNNINGGIGF